MTEFAARGYAGARVERIARGARVNRAMLYYYYGRKDRLFERVLATACAGMLLHSSAVEEGLLERVSAWSQRGNRDERLLRVVEWAIIEGRFGPNGAMALAAASPLASSSELFEGPMSRRLSDWMLVSAALLPVMWPAVTAAVVGEAPSSPRFRVEHARLLRAVASAFNMRAQTGQVGPGPDTTGTFLERSRAPLPPASRQRRK